MISKRSHDVEFFLQKSFIFNVFRSSVCYSSSIMPTVMWVLSRVFDSTNSIFFALVFLTSRNIDLKVISRFFKKNVRSKIFLISCGADLDHIGDPAS